MESEEGRKESSLSYENGPRRTASAMIVIVTMLGISLIFLAEFLLASISLGKTFGTYIVPGQHFVARIACPITFHVRA